MGVIVLKHLAREFDMDPFRLRQVLRKEYGYAKGRRWRWDEDVKAEAKELGLIRKFLTGRKGGQKPKGSSSSTGTSTPAKSSGVRTSKLPVASTKDHGASAVVEKSPAAVQEPSSAAGVPSETLSAEEVSFREAVARMPRSGGSRKSGASPRPKK